MKKPPAKPIRPGTDLAECKHCGAMVRIDRLQKHFFKVHTPMVVHPSDYELCPRGCGVRVLKKNLSDHLAGGCAKRGMMTQTDLEKRNAIPLPEPYDGHWNPW